MYVARIDEDYYQKHKVALRKLKNQYREKFGECFPSFCHEVFIGTTEKCAMQVYHETLENSLKCGEPFEYDEEDWD